MTILRSLVAGAGMLASSLAFAQAPPTSTTPPPPTATQPAAPPARDCAPAQLPGTQGQSRADGTAGQAQPQPPLTDRLASSGGVLCPPAGVDPDIRAPTPDAGRTPVIRPPGADPSARPN